MPWTTPVLCDAHPRRRSPTLVVRGDGGHAAFCGAIVAVRCFEDTARVRELAAAPGVGRGIVVDGQGSLRCALLGDRIAEHAVRGWAGLLIHGGVRDVEALAALPLGVPARAACPCKTDRRGLGEGEAPLQFAGVACVPGHWLYAERNGVLVAAQALLPA